mmetsp:Transcript_39219/g.88115  ORF Transcript_39219/g.88115 Transcript_39219/m.88115 type:complete len:302 (+) Transcript_39219:1319-2224(+)
MFVAQPRAFLKGLARFFGETGLRSRVWHKVKLRQRQVLRIYSGSGIYQIQARITCVALEALAARIPTPTIEALHAIAIVTCLGRLRSKREGGVGGAILPLRTSENLHHRPCRRSLQAHGVTAELVPGATDASGINHHDLPKWIPVLHICLHRLRAPSVRKKRRHSTEALVPMRKQPHVGLGVVLGNIVQCNRHSNLSARQVQHRRNSFARILGERPRVGGGASRKPHGQAGNGDRHVAEGRQPDALPVIGNHVASPGQGCLAHACACAAAHSINPPGSGGVVRVQVSVGSGAKAGQSVLVQ